MLSPLPPRKERDYIASMEQLASVELVSFEEGFARGSRMAVFDNGSGLHFTVCPDRALDIVECRFDGIPLVFRGASGYKSAAFFENGGVSWLRNWQAGMMTTVGLRNAGTPNGEFGLHGRASNLPAQDLSIRRGLDENDKYRLEISGEAREASVFGENLRLQRSISTGYQDNSITVRDTITNLAPRVDYLQLLYHCNFGYPLVSPDLEFLTQPIAIRGRDEKASRNISRWNKMEVPTPDYVEECFFHTLERDERGFAHFAIQNRTIGVKLEMAFSTELPNFVEWKNNLTGEYVLGLEPTNTTLQGRETDIKNGTARKLEPGEALSTEVKFTFSKI